MCRHFCWKSWIYVCHGYHKSVPISVITPKSSNALINFSGNWVVRFEAFGHLSRVIFIHTYEQMYITIFKQTANIKYSQFLHFLYQAMWWTQGITILFVLVCENIAESRKIQRKKPLLFLILLKTLTTWSGIQLRDRLLCSMSSTGYLWQPS